MNVLKESYRYIKRYNVAWIISTLVGFISLIAAMMLPQVPQLIIDKIINPALGADPVASEGNIFAPIIELFSPDDYFGMLKALLIIMGVLLIVRYASHYGRWFLAHFFGVKAEKDLRLAAFGKMLDQNSLVMARYTSGDLMSICNSDPTITKDFWALNLPILLDQLVAISLAVFFLSRINAYLILVPAVMGVVTAVIMIFYTRDLRRCYNRIREASVDLNSCIQENINGVRIIRAYASEKIETEKFEKRNKNFKDGYLNQAKVLARYNIFFMTASQLVSLGSVIIGVILAVKGYITVGQFTTFASYVGMINSPIIMLANYIGVMQNAIICGNRLFTFLNTSNMISDPESPLEIEGKPDLSMRNVSIRLDDNEELKEVSVDIPYGKKLGIMGKTGAGKSVMIKAFTRLFETSIGETCINGQNIKNYRVEDVRRQFSYVMQDVFLFSNTVDSNIAYYNPDASHEEVERVAKIAQAHDFIQKLSDGYETVVGERGLGLSGGQKQRISIARALLKDAPIILLDDCTSALDMETERKILKGLQENYADRTLIITSHRASSVEGCDEILYLEKGRITERGSHKELMALKGKYYDVYTSQEAAHQEAIS